MSKILHNVIILAAGKGTRMKSKLYKVLHRVCGRTMVGHVLHQVKKLRTDHVITVVGYGAAAVKKTLGDQTEYVTQAHQRGTGDAVLRAEPILKNGIGDTMVLSGDTPLLRAATLRKLFQQHDQSQAAATILTAKVADPTGYGRIVKDAAGNVQQIVEQKDANASQRAIHEVNTGVYVFDNQQLFKALHRINDQNAQGEYYLTDVIQVLRKAGQQVQTYQMNDPREAMNVNTRAALSRANRIMHRRINDYLMDHGVSILAPNRTDIDVDVKIGADTVIEPNVRIHPGTVIGSQCVIGANSEIYNCRLHDHVRVIASYLQDSTMDEYSNIGPYSHLRPKAVIGPHVHLGNFVEVKAATIGAGTKVGHLTYVGNAKLGKNINVGCGVIFCNYDGAHKHTSTVGDGAFIGSNSDLIAPVHVADHAFIAAGTNVTRDVNRYDMAIARSRQTNKPGYYKKLPYRG